MPPETTSERQAESEGPGLARRVIVRGWPLIVMVLAMLGVTVAQLVRNTTSVSYESTGTYIVRPRGGDDVTKIDAGANLNGTVRIGTTFARIAESKLIGDRAWEALGPVAAGADRLDASVDAAITRRANILSISARTTQPELANALAAAAGSETVRYIEGLADLYDLTVLDPPSDARRSAPRATLPGRLAAAGLLGLGIGFATRPFIRGGLLASPDPDSPYTLDTGIDSERYTRQRLREERNRTDSSGVPFHLLVIQPDAVPHGIDIPAIARTVSSILREEDHVGHLGESRPGTIVAILPGRTDEEVERLTSTAHDLALERLRRRFGPHVDASAVWCRYEAGAFHGDPGAIQIAEA